MTRAPRTAARLLVATSLGLTGCAGTLNRTIKKAILPDAMAWQDLELSCTFGQAAVGLIEPIGKAPADVAMILGWLPAGVCAELEGWEARRQEARLMKTHGGEPSLKIAAATDAAYRAERAFTLAATRYDQAYRHWELRYGSVEDCSKLSDGEQQVYLLGLLSGALSLVVDSAAKGKAGVPKNRLLDVARSTACLDDARFFHIPAAVRAAAWATIPGSGPEGVDPWSLLEDAAQKGDALGQSIPRSLLVFTAANAGKTDVFDTAVSAFAGLEQGKQPAAAGAAGAPLATEWSLMDAYGWAQALYQADLVWLKETGHRAPSLGDLPVAPGGAEEDPFGSEDPFGADDPFGGGDVDEESSDAAVPPSDSPDSETAPADDAAPATDSGDAP